MDAESAKKLNSATRRSLRLSWGDMFPMPWKLSLGWRICPSLGSWNAVATPGIVSVLKVKAGPIGYAPPNRICVIWATRCRGVRVTFASPRLWRFWTSGPRPRREMRCKREPHRRETWPAGASAGRGGRLNGKAAVAFAEAAFRTYSDRLRLRRGLAEVKRPHRWSRRVTLSVPEKRAILLKNGYTGASSTSTLRPGGPECSGGTWRLGR